MNRETFTQKQVLILVIAIVAGIAFAETSSPMWSLSFWREFGLKLIIYGAISEFVVILLSSNEEKNI